MENSAKRKHLTLFNALIVLSGLAYVFQTAVFAYLAVERRNLLNAGLLVEGIPLKNVKLTLVSMCDDNNNIVCLSKGDYTKVMTSLAYLNAYGLLKQKEKQNTSSDDNKTVAKLANMTKNIMNKKPFTAVATSSCIFESIKDKIIKGGKSGWL